MTDDDARAIMTRTRPTGTGPRAVALAQAVARVETRYARGWRCPAMIGSFNWGAIHSRDDGAPCTDHDAAGRPYTARFARYASDVAGASALWEQLWRRAPVRRVLMDDALDVDGLARAMRVTGYFEAPAEHYARMLRAALREIV